MKKATKTYDNPLAEQITSQRERAEQEKKLQGKCAHREGWSEVLLSRMFGEKGVSDSKWKQLVISDLCK